MKTKPFARHTGAILVAGLIASATFLGACAGSNRAPFKAEAAPAATLNALEGDWTPQREGARVRELSVERAAKGWRVEIERIDDAGELIESTFPARILSINSRTILEVEIARGKTGGNNSQPAAAFFYSSVNVEGDTLRSSPLSADWLRAYTSTHPSLKIAAVTPWGNDRALGVGRAEGLSSMIQAAAADPKAWDEASLWTRAPENRDDAKGAKDDHDDAKGDDDAKETSR